jgi:membrane dipeptidase
MNPTTSAADSVSTSAAAILASADVWDVTLPWMPVFWDMAVLSRFKRAGFTFVSLTTQDWPPTF